MIHSVAEMFSCLQFSTISQIHFLLCFFNSHHNEMQSKVKIKLVCEMLS